MANVYCLFSFFDIKIQRVGPEVAALAADCLTAFTEESMRDFANILCNVYIDANDKHDRAPRSALQAIYAIQII